MTFSLTYLIVLAVLLVTGSLAVRRFFMTNSSAGYVFVAIGWLVFAIVAAIFTLFLKKIVG